MSDECDTNNKKGPCQVSGRELISIEVSNPGPQVNCPAG